ncbi:aldehyde dehydrogenase family protein [Tsukamurella soli]
MSRGTDQAAVHDAVRAARRGAAEWSAMTGAERRHHLLRWKQAMYRRRGEILQVLQDETGKVGADAQIELTMTLHHLDWAAHHAHRVLRPRRVAPGMLMLDHRASVERRPFGVVGVIGPWNYPIYTPMGSVSYALAAGNVVVLKPSEHAPRAGRWLADTFRDASGLDAVLQAIPGGPEAGEALCEAGVDKLAFTGSARTGARVMATCAAHLTPVVMELGGKDAAIVAADADLSSAADAIMWGATMNSGQSCAGIERVYVVDDVAEPFTAIMAERAGRLRAGVDYGQMTVPAQVEIVRRHIHAAIADGGVAVVGGPHSVRPPYIDPVVLLDVPEMSTAVTEETFGPTVTITVVPDIETAISRANAVDYGLGAAVFSRRRGREIARRLDVGMVSINDVVSFGAVPGLPFGGRGGSGFGRIHGAEGLREFTSPVSVSERRRVYLPTRVDSHRRRPWDLPVLRACLHIVGAR